MTSHIASTITSIMMLNALLLVGFTYNILLSYLQPVSVTPMALLVTAALSLGRAHVPVRMCWGSSVMSVEMATGVSPRVCPVFPVTAAQMAPAATSVTRSEDQFLTFGSQHYSYGKKNIAYYNSGMRFYIPRFFLS